MEEAAVSYAEGVAKALAGKLGQLLSDEYQLLKSVRDGVVHLRDEVAIMNALLRMLSEAEDASVNHFIREWTKQVRELNYDAEDCVDIFARRISSSSAPPGAWLLHDVRHLFVTLGARRRLARDIKDLRARARDISERRARYNVDSQALRPAASFAASPSASVVTSAAASTPADDVDDTDGQLVGIKDQVDILAAKVRPTAADSNNPEDAKRKVFSIVGFGGLGKTTLAMEVCRSLVPDFVCQANVSVSQAFDASKDLAGLLRKILEQLLKVMKREKHKDMQEKESVGDLGAMDVDRLTSTIRDFVHDKRYLIMLDDVWTIAAWDTILCRLPENNHGSRIVITTRMENVAKACCSPATISEDNIYRIQQLSPQDSEKLFVKRVFGAKNICPEGLKEAMNDILKKCGGLPLAIVNIASLLANYKSHVDVGMWHRMCNSIGSQMEINPTLEGMRQIITLSYNHMPYYLKACMMYLSIFPEDYMIDKRRLLYRWIAEGLIPEKRGLTSREVAEAYFDELLSRNMIKPGLIDCDGVMECCVHDMMLEVILSKALEENFISLVGGPCRGFSYDNIRRLSIHGEDQRSSMAGMSMQHVRSVSMFCPKGQVKLLDRLKEFTLLRVLDLEGCKDVMDHHMKHVCRLFLLRFLSLRRTDVTEIPYEIEKLQHLQLLDLRDTLLKGVPESLINLEKLEILDLNNRDNWQVLLKLPKGLRKMKALQRLDRFELSDDVDVAREIGELVQLSQLGVVLMNSTEQVQKSLADSISKIISLDGMTIENPNGNNMKFLHGLSSPPQLLRSICICGTIDKFPNWVESHKHLAEIYVYETKLHGDQIFGALCKLPNLVKLSLDRYSYMDEQLVAHTDFKFRSLKKLFMVPDCGPPKVLQFAKEAMTELEVLTVRFNLVDRTLRGIEHLSSLKEEIVGWSLTVVSRATRAISSPPLTVPNPSGC